MTEPKGEKPESEHPHEDDFPLELNLEHEGAPSEGGEHLPEDVSMSASIEEFHFSGPAEELDFTEPADFAFPSVPGGETEAHPEYSSEFAPAEHAEGEHFFGGEETTFAQPLEAEADAMETIVAGEGIADLEAADEGEIEKPKRRRELPAWVRTLEWATVGVLAVGSLLALLISAFYIDNNPQQVTLILNVSCTVMLLLIPYALWRSARRWTTLPVTAAYTIMLALSTAMLIAGTWFEGQELASYGWQFNKTRVAKGKPMKVNVPMPDMSAAKDSPDAAGKGPAEPAK